MEQEGCPLSRRWLGGVNRLFRHLWHFYACDLLFKFHCEAGYMHKMPKVYEDSILAAGGGGE